MKKAIIVFCSLFIVVNALLAQNNYSISNKLDWNQYKSILHENNQQGSQLLPKTHGRVAIKEKQPDITVQIKHISYKPLTQQELETLIGYSFPDEPLVATSISCERKKNIANYSFVPFRINPITNEPERVDTYSLTINVLEKTTKSTSTYAYPEHSKLKTGNWYKIKIDTTGVYKLTYNELISIGLTQPENVRVYGHGGKQLPYMNNEPFYDDMVENPIVMEKGSDNVFNEGDYILFYGEGPLTWELNPALDMFVHQIHYYSDYIYLFVTDSFGPGERIAEQDNSSLTANNSSESFDSYQCHEENTYNLIRSGRKWYGNFFKSGDTFSKNFHFPNIIANEEASANLSITSRIESNAPNGNFIISNNNTNLESIFVKKVTSQYTYAREFSRSYNVLAEKNININISFTGGSNSSEAYVDFICVNAKEKLIFNNKQQLNFRDKNSVAQGNITTFNLISNEPLTVWDVTEPTTPVKIKLVSTDQGFAFNAKTDTLREFIGFKNNQFLTPIIESDDTGKVANQDLHGIQPHDMVIVTHPLFKDEAEELAVFHRDQDNLSTYVVTPQKIYNEFSSGTPDVTAIRNFMKMLYNKANSEDELPKYLLLFGDGSYDNKSNHEGNSNFILTYQNNEGVIETNSFVTDDFFGLLDPNEGGSTGNLDIGIGRFPVQTNKEAQVLVDKVKHYTSTASYGNWRTKICFIGDDEDGAIHMRQANNIAKKLDVSHPEFNIEKIFLDAYPQNSTPAGERYPEVTRAINEAVSNGALIIDYVGHGNPRLLTDEEVMNTAEVKKWTNYDKLSVFVTASCEVGRYDDFDRTSMGEWFILNPKGGGVATLTTTRVVYSGGNDDLNNYFFDNVFNKELRLGDVIMLAKNKTGTINQTNKRNFSLLGDPAIKLGFPLNEVVPSTINDIPIASGGKKVVFSEVFINDDGSTLKKTTVPAVDTLSALSKASVHGYIVDTAGNILDQLNGTIYPTVYDKPTSITTFGHDSHPFSFTLQNNVLFKGAASIKNGFFDFSFIVPKDINYKFGKGKISLYAIIDSMEAIGVTQDIIIGGSSENAAPDNTGPEVFLYLNDTTFVSGQTTNENPILFIKLFDDSGINTTGNGIGHNITAVLDENQDKKINLNNFYQSNIDDYKSGEIKYPLETLSPGFHTIRVKAWDIYNNSTESEVGFYVFEGNQIYLDNLTNMPNPFYDETRFVFNHNQASKEIDIAIYIYDMMGNHITTLNQKQYNSGFKVAPISWNGTDHYGNKLDKGMYIYRVDLTTVDGKKTSKSSKLMIFR